MPLVSGKEWDEASCSCKCVYLALFSAPGGLHVVLGPLPVISWDGQGQGSEAREGFFKKVSRMLRPLAGRVVGNHSAGSYRYKLDQDIYRFAEWVKPSTSCCVTFETLVGLT